MTKKILHTLLFATLLAACSGSDEGGGTDPNNTNANTEGGTYATRYEVPALNDDDIFHTYTTSENGKEQVTYSVSFNKERKHSRWVAFTFESNNREIKVDRSNKFQPDPGYIGQHTMTSSQINNNGFQRGHLVASYDRVYSQEANEQTFYMSNISPMIGSFNSDAGKENTSLWNDLEYKINQAGKGWGRNKDFADILYIVKGGTITEGKYTTKGSCPTVPTHYFMAIVRKKNNLYHAVAFLLPHVNSLADKQLSNYAVTIDELEDFTGIDFFCNLPDRLENAIESKIEKNIWNL